MTVGTQICQIRQCPDKIYTQGSDSYVLVRTIAETGADICVCQVEQITRWGERDIICMPRQGQ